MLSDNNINDFICQSGKSQPSPTTTIIHEFFPFRSAPADLISYPPSSGGGGGRKTIRPPSFSDRPQSALLPLPTGRGSANTLPAAAVRPALLRPPLLILIRVKWGFFKQRQCRKGNENRGRLRREGRGEFLRLMPAPLSSAIKSISRGEAFLRSDGKRGQGYFFYHFLCRMVRLLCICHLFFFWRNATI